MSVSSDSETAQRLYNFRFLFLVEGAVLVLLGCLAIVVPSISSSTTTLLVGWVFLISGIVGFVPMFLAETYPGLWWSLISALLAVLVGVTLITNSSQDLYGGLIGWPFQGTALSPIRKVLVMFFLIEGGASIMFAFEHRCQFTARWAWMVLSGIVDLMLGTIIIFDLPGTSEWTMGLLIGINMILGGSALIAMGWGFTRAIHISAASRFVP
jgi:uncharacterized membrane protein HdeD (DUF308 family)